jgi:hypothetical protein
MEGAGHGTLTIHLVRTSTSFSLDESDGGHGTPSDGPIDGFINGAY